MGYLNENLSINVKKLGKNIEKELDFIIYNELYYALDISEEKMQKIKNNIIKEMKNQIRTEYFMYKIMDENKCVYKHNRGKNDGFFCHKKINTKIKEGTKDFLCCTHSKKHIPKKRKVINNIEYNNHDLGTQIIKEKGQNENIISKNIERLGKLPNNSEIIKYINNKNNLDKFGLFQNKTNIKKNFNNKNLNIIKNYCYYNNNIVCRFGYNCHKNNCSFKHKNNNFLLSDFIFNTNKTIISY